MKSLSFASGTVNCVTRACMVTSLIAVVGAAWQDSSANSDGRKSAREEAVCLWSLLLACGFDHVPRGVGQIREIVEFTRAAKPESAVDHHTLAIYVFGLLTQEVGREVGQLFVPAETLHGMGIFRAVFQFL